MKTFAAILCVLLAVAADAKERNPRAAFEQATALLEKGDAAAGLRGLDALRRAENQPRVIAAIDTMRGIALLMLDREAESVAATLGAELVLGQHEPLVALFEIAANAQRLDVARPILERLVSAYPDVARELPYEGVFHVLRGLNERKQRDASDALAIGLAQIGFGGERFEVCDSMAMWAVRLLVERGRTEEARPLAARIIDRDLLEELLTLRRYQPLWSELETRIGDRMDQPIAEAVILSERLFNGNNADVRLRASLVEAYANADRLNDADRIAREFAPDAGRMKTIDEAGGWLVNLHAVILSKLGRSDDGDRRMAALRVLGIEQNPWLIGMVINRIENLVHDGKYARAIELLPEADQQAAKWGNPYARQLLRRLWVCASVKQPQRVTDHDARVIAMAAAEADSPIVTAEALMCVGRREDAKRIVLKALAEKDPWRAVEGLQEKPAAPGGDPSRWAGWLLPLLEDPAVRTAFDKVGRALPKRFRRDAAKTQPLAADNPQRQMMANG